MSSSHPKQTRVPFWSCILVLISGLWWGLKQIPDPIPKPMLEVCREYLTLNSGRLFRAQSRMPFDGWMVKYYPTGRMKSRSEVKGGKLWGVSDGWFTNGVKQVREHFVDGVSHGVRTKWFENRRKASEVNIHQGKLHGTFLRWDERGQMVESVSLKNGEPDGESLAWYPDGSLKARAVMDKGKIVEQKSWKQGEYAGNDAPKSGH